jgi:hypothetical protein
MKVGKTLLSEIAGTTTPFPLKYFYLPLVEFVPALTTFAM